MILEFVEFVERALPNSPSSFSKDCRTRRVQLTAEGGFLNSSSSLSDDSRIRRFHLARIAELAAFVEVVEFRSISVNSGLMSRLMSWPAHELDHDPAQLMSWLMSTSAGPE